MPIRLSPCQSIGLFVRAIGKRRILHWTIFVIILILWLLGFSLHIAGGLIHLLLVVALIVLLVQPITGRRTVL